MRFIILITTYQRIQYLQQLIESIRINTQPHHSYHIAINDDGSTDGSREYIKNLCQQYRQKPNNISFHTLYSNNKGAHHANNSLLLYARSINYDFGFKMDDDLIITKRGWEDIYHRYARESGNHHLVHYSQSWSGREKPARLPVESVQGAFWTFTPEILDKVGFIDTKNMGKRGIGHIDFTARCCRLGFNNIDDVKDAPNANEYIKLHPKEGYVLTPNYDKILFEEKKNTEKKLSFVRKKSRLYVPLPESPINYFFDHIYLLNLERRKDRLKKVQSTLEDIKVSDYEVFKAIDGLAVCNTNSQLVTPGVFGCYQSHISIMEDAVSKKYERVLVLEDDIIPHKNIKKLSENLYQIPKDWSIIYLGASESSYKNEAIKMADYTKPYHPSRSTDGTFAYGLTRWTIEKTLPTIKNNNPSIPIDTALHGTQRVWPCYTMYPKIFIADISDSDIRTPSEISKSIDYKEQVNWNPYDYHIEK